MVNKLENLTKELEHTHFRSTQCSVLKQKLLDAYDMIETLQVRLASIEEKLDGE